MKTIYRRLSVTQLGLYSTSLGTLALVLTFVRIARIAGSNWS